MSDLTYRVEPMDQNLQGPGFHGPHVEPVDALAVPRFPEGRGGEERLEVVAADAEHGAVTSKGVARVVRQENVIVLCLLVLTGGPAPAEHGVGREGDLHVGPSLPAGRLQDDLLPASVLLLAPFGDFGSQEGPGRALALAQDLGRGLAQVGRNREAVRVDVVHDGGQAGKVGGGDDHGGLGVLGGLLPGLPGVKEAGEGGQAGLEDEGVAAEGRGRRIATAIAGRPHHEVGKEILPRQLVGHVPLASDVQQRQCVKEGIVARGDLPLESLVPEDLSYLVRQGRVVSALSVEGPLVRSCPGIQELHDDGCVAAQSRVIERGRVVIVATTQVHLVLLNGADVPHPLEVAVPHRAKEG